MDAGTPNAMTFGTSVRLPTGSSRCQNDPSLTRFGRYIQAASLDELPQLFQVFSGTMSLVGPQASASPRRTP